jgi:hypothetical protein
MLNPSIYTCQDVIKEDLTTLVHLENVSFQWNEFITWETIPLYSTLMDVTLQALLAYKGSCSFYLTFDTQRVDPCQQTRTCILYAYTQLCICIRIVFCIMNGTLHFYTPPVVYILATHSSSFVLVTPNFSLHNSCLGRGKLFVRKSAYCTSVLQYLISTSPLSTFSRTK